MTSLHSMYPSERFNIRPVYNPSTKARLALVEDLRRFVCVCAHGMSQDCGEAESGLPIKSVSACMRVLESALDGPESEVTPAIRRAVYDALSKCIKHQRPGYNSKLDHSGQFATRGLKDKDRTVRLRAGSVKSSLPWTLMLIEPQALCCGIRLSVPRTGGICATSAPVLQLHQHNHGRWG